MEPCAQGHQAAASGKVSGNENATFIHTDAECASLWIGRVGTTVSKQAVHTATPPATPPHWRTVGSGPVAAAHDTQHSLDTMMHLIL